MATDLDSAKYVSFTTYKKDGTKVSLPVWIVPFDGGYAFTTDHTSYKVRRVRHDPRATLRACNARGRVAEGTIEHTGAAVVLDEDQTRAVVELIKKKYRIGWMMLGVLGAVKKLTGGSTASGDCAIKVTLHH